VLLLYAVLYSDTVGDTHRSKRSSHWPHVDERFFTRWCTYTFISMSLHVMYSVHMPLF